jgi:hypothetical protein
LNAFAAFATSLLFCETGTEKKTASSFKHLQRDEKACEKADELRNLRHLQARRESLREGRRASQSSAVSTTSTSV